MPAEIKNWIPEVLAAFIVGVFVSAVAYQWLTGDGLSDVMVAVFVLTVLSAVATLFGVDRLKDAAKLWFD